MTPVRRSCLAWLPRLAVLAATCGLGAALAQTPKTIGLLVGFPPGVGLVPDFIENHKAGKVRVLAVLGGARQAALPDVPTFAELGLGGLEDMPYYGVFAPAGTPKAFVDQFFAAVARVIALPEVRKQLTQMGLTVAHMSPDQLARRERAYAQVWTRIVRDSGFQPQ